MKILRDLDLGVVDFTQDLSKAKTNMKFNIRTTNTQKDAISMLSEAFIDILEALQR